MNQSTCPCYCNQHFLLITNWCTHSTVRWWYSCACALDWRRRWRWRGRERWQRQRRWSTWRSRELIHKILYHFFCFPLLLSVLLLLFSLLLLLFLWIVWGFVISVHVYPNNFTSWRSLKKLLSSLRVCPPHQECVCMCVCGARTERNVRQLAGPTVQKIWFVDFFFGQL